MYIEKVTKRGYNEYTNIDVNNGEGSMMDIGLLILEPGDSYTFHETDKEVSWILMKGEAIAEFDGQEILMTRPNPFDYAPWCLLQSKGSTSKVTAKVYSELYVQKAYNDRTYKSYLYTAKDVDTWTRGADNLEGTMLRDVRTCYDYESRPDSNMVLGEVVNRPGKWSSYPPHYHPQPEVYFYFFERENGFGAGWTDGRPYEIHNHGCLIANGGDTHQQVMAPGYACCYIWGIRHLPDNPWEKTRIDHPKHAWVLDESEVYWNGLEKK